MVWWNNALSILENYWKTGETVQSRVLLKEVGHGDVPLKGDLAWSLPVFTVFPESYNLYSSPLQPCHERLESWAKVNPLLSFIYSPRSLVTAMEKLLKKKLTSVMANLNRQVDHIWNELKSKRLAYLGGITLGLLRRIGLLQVWIIWGQKTHLKSWLRFLLTAYSQWHGGRKLLLSRCLPSLSQPSSFCCWGLEPISLGCQWVPKSSWDIQPCRLNNS